MPAERLHALLEQHDVPYVVTTHEYAVTAQQVAGMEGISGYDVAKPVLVSVGGELAMIVIPGAEMLDLDRLGEVLGHNEVRLASEAEFVEVFDDCEPGAEPPFGMLYGIPTFMDQDLRARRRLVCRDGSHTQTIELATADYIDLVDPEIIDVALTPA
jgi:Ala-tRNA(Pro) deacylase